MSCTASPGALRPRCRCPRCRAVSLRTVKALTAGVSVAPSYSEMREHAERLLSVPGITVQEVSVAAGMAPGTLGRMLKRWAEGAEPALAYRNRRALMALRPEDLAPHTVPSWPVQRRLQALAVLGWPIGVLAAESGVKTKTLREVRDKYATCTPAVDAAVRGMYARLQDTPYVPTVGTSRAYSRTVHDAAALGWASSLAWDDDTIDDENAQPWVEADAWPVCEACQGFGRVHNERYGCARRCPSCRGVGAVRPKKPPKKNPIDIEEVRWLARAGGTWESITVRLGLSPDAVYTHVHRSHDRALLDLIMRNSNTTPAAEEETAS